MFQFRVWARPDAIEQVNYALETGIKIIEFFETYFDIPFPLPKQGKPIHFCHPYLVCMNNNWCSPVIMVRYIVVNLQ